MGWHTKGNVPLVDYYRQTTPERTKTPRSPEEFQAMTYKERLQLSRTNPKLYALFAHKSGRKQSWER